MGARGRSAARPRLPGCCPRRTPSCPALASHSSHTQLRNRTQRPSDDRQRAKGAAGEGSQRKCTREILRESSVSSSLLKDPAASFHLGVLGATEWLKPSGRFGDHKAY
ncbi:hypothetical protein MRX96_042269 [Rhipicephalus microplus]